VALIFLWIGPHDESWLPQSCFTLKLNFGFDWGNQEQKRRVGGIEMESYQWFFLGMMVAFTPSLLVLSVLLARSMHISADPHQSSE
jgi:hypothetical protein